MTLAGTATPTRAAIASVAMATLLVALKGWAALLTGSVAMLGSLADAGLDLVASLVTLAGVRIAAIPADHDHRFGHGKAEALAALFQMALVAASAALIAWRAVRAFGDVSPPDHASAGIAVSLFAMLLTAVLLAYQNRVIRATGSIAIRADQLHYKTDFLLNGAVLAALLLEGGFGLRGADPLFGLLIAGWLARGAWIAARLAVDQLMDREWPLEKRRRFLDLAAAAHPLAGVHDLRTRTAGGTDFAQFHIWLPADMTVAAAHDVMDVIEGALRIEFGSAEILIHVDPEGQIDAEGVLPSSLAEEAAR